MLIPIQSIVPNPEQPRTEIDPEELKGLAASLQADGLLNAISVEGPHDGDTYILIDGERRWRAAQLIGWTEIEAVVKPSMNGNGAQDRLMLALIGNLQRSDMGPVDEAHAYMRLRVMGQSVEQIAARVGRSVPHVYGRLKLLEFPEEIQTLYNQRTLPISERVFSALRNLTPEQAVSVAKRAANNRAGETQIVATCTRISKHKTQKTHRHPQAPVPSDSTAPAIDLNRGLPKAFQMLDAPLRESCKKCGLFEEGGKLTICSGCPLVDFVSRLKE